MTHIVCKDYERHGFSLGVECIILKTLESGMCYIQNAEKKNMWIHLTELKEVENFEANQSELETHSPNQMKMF